MNVHFIVTTSTKLDGIPITNGNIIALSDKSDLIYDMNGVRHNITTEIESIIDNKFKELHTVAKTGNYNDLINKPTAVDLEITSIQLEIILPANWIGEEAPYTQTISIDKVTPTSIVDIDAASSVTAEQLDAYINAKIIDSEQSAGSITLKAFGEKPTIEIPLKVVIRRV